MAKISRKESSVPAVRLSDSARNRQWNQRRRISTILCAWIALVDCPRKASAFSLCRRRAQVAAEKTNHVRANHPVIGSSSSSFSVPSPLSLRSCRSRDLEHGTNHTYSILPLWRSASQQWDQEIRGGDCDARPLWANWGISFQHGQQANEGPYPFPWRHDNQSPKAVLNERHILRPWKIEELLSIQTQPSATTQQEQQQDEIALARLLGLFAAALYGTNFALVKLLMFDGDGGSGEEAMGMPVGLSTTLRFGMAALATSPWLFAKNRETHEYGEARSLSLYDNDARGAAWTGFEVGMWNSIGYIAQSVGLTSTGAGESAFLCSLAVVVVPFLNWWSGAQLKSREWVGATLALAGVALLELGGTSSSNSYETMATSATIMDSSLETILTINESTIAMPSEDVTFWTFGRMASMIQPFAFGMGFFRMEEAMQRYPTQASRSTAAQLVGISIVSALYCGIIEGGCGGFRDPIWDGQQMQAWLSDPTLWALIAYTGIISTALSIYLETRALRTLSAAETTILLSTEPIWGAAFAAMLLGEHFGQDAAFGGLMILGGCLYSNLGADGIHSFLHSCERAVTGRASAETSRTNQHHEQHTLSLVGATSAILGSSVVGAWNNLSVGARLTVLQLRDLLEDLFP